MGPTHLKTCESSGSWKHHKLQDVDWTSTISSWMMFQPHPNKSPKGNQEWKIPHMARPQQSTIVKAYASQNFNNLRTYWPGNKNLQYTKHVKSEVEVEEYSNFYPDSETVKTHELCATIIYFNLKRKGLSDLTSAFPHKSKIWNLYVMVLYDYDSNIILAEPI